MVRRSSHGLFTSFLIFAFISAFLFAGEKIGFTQLVRFPLETILIPPRKILYEMKLRFSENIYLLLTPHLQKKIRESEEFKRELDVLRVKIQLLEEENSSLRRQLEAPLPASWDFIPASVLGRGRYLVIDKGRQDKVDEGMIVVFENIVIGQVNLVTPKTAQVMLLSDPDSKIPAKTDKNVKGLLLGSFGSQMILSRVIQREALSPLNFVLTSGEEGKFPPNLLIGKIEKVESKEEEVYKEAKVTPLVDYDKLRQVFIVSKY